MRGEPRAQGWVGVRYQIFGMRNVLLIIALPLATYISANG